MSSPISISRLNPDQEDFDQALSQLLAWNDETDQQVTETVQNILSDVRSRGDQALIETTNKFDRRSVSKMSELELSVINWTLPDRILIRKFVRRWKQQRNVSKTITSINYRNPGVTLKKTAPFSASKSRPWNASAFTFPVAKRLTLLPY